MPKTVEYRTRSRTVYYVTRYESETSEDGLSASDAHSSSTYGEYANVREANSVCMALAHQEGGVAQAFPSCELEAAHQGMRVINQS